jgi:hypothetical protein
MSPITLHYDPRLLEEAVFLAQRTGRDAPGLRRERDRIYAIADQDERERRFGELYRSWFARLQLGKILDQALEEQPAITSMAASCFVVFAGHAKEEGAELFVASDTALETQRRTIGILLRPESLLDTEPLLAFLRHELFHIADMLDPAFAYEPVLPPGDAGPTYDALLRERYRTLWDTAINGRMHKRGWLPDSSRNRQLSEFALSFPMLGDATSRIFDLFFVYEPHSHPEFVAFAQNPRAALDADLTPTQPGSRCALCGFPTYTFEPCPERLDNAAMGEIIKDFPRWRPADGLCKQCAELYRARRLSVAAARCLPGWREESSAG